MEQVQIEKQHKEAGKEEQKTQEEKDGQSIDGSPSKCLCNKKSAETMRCARIKVSKACTNVAKNLRTR